MGVKNGVLRPQSLTIFLFLYEKNNNVSQLILATCSYIVFIRLVDVLCCYCQKIAFLGNFGGQKGFFRVPGCYYFHIFLWRRYHSVTIDISNMFIYSFYRFGGWSVPLLPKNSTVNMISWFFLPFSCILGLKSPKIRWFLGFQGRLLSSFDLILPDTLSLIIIQVILIVIKGSVGLYNQIA